MAYGAKKIFPIDTKPGKAVGVSLPFNAPAVFYSTYTTKDAIRNNLINYFLTNKTERYLNPTFGGNIRQFIFEQISEGNIDILKEIIGTDLINYFPNVEVQNLNVYTSPDINTVQVELSYSVIDTGITDEIQLEFN